MIFFTADLHLGHAKIIEYCNRPFKYVDEMDEALIGNWNDVVGPEDTVYHIGDFTLGGPDIAANYFRRLNGRIIVLRGSHDDKWFRHFTSNDELYVSNTGTPVEYGEMLTVLDFPRYKRNGYPLRISLCHYALQVWPLSHYGALHLFGHSHGKLSSGGMRRADVGVDALDFTAVAGYERRFRPILLEVAMAQLEKRPLRRD